MKRKMMPDWMSARLALGSAMRGQKRRMQLIVRTDSKEKTSLSLKRKNLQLVLVLQPLAANAIAMPVVTVVMMKCCCHCCHGSVDCLG